MRSFDRTMPEELNRVLADHASDLLLCSSATPAEHLRHENVSGEVVVVGDVMVDVAQLLAPRARERTVGAGGLRGRAGRLPARHRAPRRHGRRPGAARAARRAAGRDARPGRAAAAPAHAGAAGGDRAAGRAASRARRAARAAARLPGLHRAAAARPRRAHRLGRRAEGGLPGRRAVRDASGPDGVDGDRPGGLERARRARRGRRAGRAGARAPGRAPAAVRRRAGRRAGRPGAAGAARAGGRSHEPLRIGVAGLGYWGPNLARNFAGIAGCELGVVLRRLRGRARALGAELPRHALHRGPRRPAGRRRARRRRARHAGADPRRARRARARRGQALLRREAARAVRRGGRAGRRRRRARRAGR